MVMWESVKESRVGFEEWPMVMGESKKKTRYTY